MVAIGGIGWSLAPSLKAFVDEADRFYPGRDHSSDGSIGDQAHASRQSDHNPIDGWVHAVDLDEDLAPGLDLKDFAERLRRRRDPRVAYGIYEGEAFYSWARNGFAAWAWQPYTGPNAHLHHLHLSILRTAAARNDLRPWQIKPPVAPAPPIAPPEDDDAMLTYDGHHPDEPTVPILVLVAGGKQVRLTGQTLGVHIRGLPTHIGEVGADEEERFKRAWGSVIL